MEQTSLPPYPVIDSHVDLLYDLMRRHEDISFGALSDAWITLPRLSDAGARIIVSAFYCPDSYNGHATAAGHLRRLLDYSDTYLDGLSPVTTSAELETCLRNTGARGVIPLLENADALLEFPLEELYRRGFRLVGLTHVGSNRLADGNSVTNPSGLTKVGRELVKNLDRLGCVIDTAHLSEPAFRQVAEHFNGPLVSTHTGLRAFFDTPRNLSEAQVETIISRDGVIGIAAAPEILSPAQRAGINDVFRQIDHLVQRHGAQGVGIGTDFGGFDAVCAGLEDHSRLPDLAQIMRRAGYPDHAIAGIMGGNWLRFFSRLLTHSPKTLQA